MHMALQRTADPIQLSQAASKSLTKTFNLSDSFTALVCPSRAAAYVTALAAIFLKNDSLYFSPQVCLQSFRQPIVVHDTCCESGSPKRSSSLVGACNLNLGTHDVPMSKETLEMIVASNRVATVFHRPYAYLPNSSFLQLHTLSSICHSQDTGIPIILDSREMPMAGTSLTDFISSLKEMLLKGADLIMLPDTERFNGPPNTCVLLGTTSMMGNMPKSLPIIQSELSFPLLSTPYDTVGTVVALNSFQIVTLQI